MAASTFAALFLAHVLADYLLQTGWMVANKRRAAALGLHIGTVLAAMPLVLLTLSPWFLVLAGLHLAIDLLKTFVMRPGLASYVLDQLLHLASIVLVAALAPGLWADSPLAALPWAPAAILIAAAVLFAARGGQYAVAARLPDDPATGARGVRMGWAERATMVGVVALGLPVLALGVALAKAAQVALRWADRDVAGRRRLVEGAGLSLGWGLACAAGLWAILPLLP
ncbi:DUF3307 domain-containing protein [Roseicyclus persicicus]|uniref:DUF3307 domain-containing protein n=1 Tax=Roseicyclus persicicus TaxID=2650661 RepID=A0A7X6H403_9RHOB|nr:DUF3307 domain-containing protein [Roseibacterium persicicum]NKX46451.1 DUF3307 domain-containing protein [Roseibacterium persicicum]